MKAARLQPRVSLPETSLWMERLDLDGFSRGTAGVVAPATSSASPLARPCSTLLLLQPHYSHPIIFETARVGSLRTLEVAGSKEASGSFVRQCARVEEESKSNLFIALLTQIYPPQCSPTGQANHSAPAVRLCRLCRRLQQVF